MKLSSIRSGGSLLLSLVMLIGSPLLASEATELRSSDYLLGQEGVLAGCVINHGGLPVSGLPVQVLHENHVIATARSDENGQFAVRGLRNGQHSVKLGASNQPVRFWSNTAAPPSAMSRMTIVIDEEVVRGQLNGVPAGGISGADILGLTLFGGAAAGTFVSTLANDPEPASP